MKNQKKILPREDIFSSLNIKDKNSSSFIGSASHSNNNRYFPTYSPIDGSVLAEVGESTLAELGQVVAASKTSFLSWRTVPAPRRGELVRLFAEKLRANKSKLASLITIEVGKIPSEAEGEVQEMIDICDFAVGLSRQLYGLTIASERSSHRLMEQWHPLGPVGVISAFNFPVAVWSWNTALALVCGNSVIWKPSEKAPLCALASHLLLCEVIDSFSDAPPGLSCLVQGGKEIGEGISASPDIPLVCATGSVATGKAVGKKVADRLGRSLLELGGNNAMIVTKSADLDLALRAITFSAAGTAGQRCTTLRRLIVHCDIKESLLENLKEVFSSIKVGSPLDEGVLLGPLIDVQARESYENALKRAVKEGGTLVHGEVVRDGVPEGGAYVRPALVSINADAAILKEETFAPILYAVEYDTFEDAIRIHNNVPQGLSSAIFTNDIREAELFLSVTGSDCGIANVNIGTSGAEIGGAFGGEKETGGGRQSGSDAWKNYMRRATNTINYSRELPLAQGVSFEVKRKSR